MSLLNTMFVPLRFEIMAAEDIPGEDFAQTTKNSPFDRLNELLPDKQATGLERRPHPYGR